MALPALAIAGAGTSILSGIGSWLANSQANERAEALQDKGLQEWLKINVPDPEQQKIVLQQFVQQGTLAPVLQKAIQQDPSAFQQVAANSSYKTAQNKALSQLEDIGNSGGLRLQDKAALQDSMLQGQVADRSNRQSIASDLAQRGQRGSGLEVAARLQGQQAVQDRNANSSLKVAADAQDRALQAIQGAGTMAGQFRTQDFGEQAQKAGAADRINQFNTQNLRDVNAGNASALTGANLYNLQQKQGVADKNTNLANQQEMYNKGLQQQQYENQLKKAQGVSGQYNNLAGSEVRGGQIAGNAISNIGSGLAGAANSEAQYDLMDQYFKNKK